MTYDYDLFVIGAGSGGVRAARMAANAGRKVGIAEEYRLGGTCVIRGCVPKKLMVYGSEFGRTFKEAAGFGWRADNIQFDWNTLRNSVAGVVDRIEGIYHTNVGKAEIDLFEARAVVKDPHTIEILGGNKEITAEKILIAVGGTPSRDFKVDPDRLGITSDDVFLLEDFPKRIVIAGGGYIALEFAHIFAGLGSDVTLVYRGERLLRAFDQDISERVEKNLLAVGVRYLNNTNFVSIGQGSDEKIITLSSGEVVHADQMMWAIGRKPITEGLGLEGAGVALDKAGAVRVNADYQTATPSIFAVGDVTNRVNLTPVAIREGAAFASTQFLDTPKRMDYNSIPKAVFTQPPVGTVGPSEDECIAAGHKIDVYQSEFRPLKNGIAGKDTQMFMKLIVEQGTERVLGCHIVGVDAPEMIQIVAIAVKAGLSKSQFDDTCALHPSAAEELVTMVTKRAPR